MPAQALLSERLLCLAPVCVSSGFKKGKKRDGSGRGADGHMREDGGFPSLRLGHRLGGFCFTELLTGGDQRPSGWWAPGVWWGVEEVGFLKGK